MKNVQKEAKQAVKNVKKAFRELGPGGNKPVPGTLSTSQRTSTGEAWQILPATSSTRILNQHL